MMDHFWLLAVATISIATAVCMLLFGQERQVIAFLSAPLSAWLIVTAYIFIFDPDPQAPIAILLFFFMALLCAVPGAAVAILIRKFRDR